METLANQTGSIPEIDDLDTPQMSQRGILSRGSAVSLGLLIGAVLATGAVVLAFKADSTRISVLETQVKAMSGHFEKIDAKVDKNAEALARIEGHLGTKPDE